LNARANPDKIDPALDPWASGFNANGHSVYAPDFLDRFERGPVSYFVKSSCEVSAFDE